MLLVLIWYTFAEYFVNISEMCPVENECFKYCLILPSYVSLRFLEFPMKFLVNDGDREFKTIKVEHMGFFVLTGSPVITGRNSERR